jgi:hypothetical protein
LEIHVTHPQTAISIPETLTITFQADGTIFAFYDGLKLRQPPFFKLMYSLWGERMDPLFIQTNL